MEDDGDGYGEYMKLRERFQSAGLSNEDADRALLCVVTWAAEMASRANRSRKPQMEELVTELEREELPNSPNKGDAMTTYEEVAVHVERPKRVKVPKTAPISF